MSGDGNKVFFDYRATLQLDSVHTILVSHTPMKKDIRHGDIIDDSGLYSFERDQDSIGDT